jgi:hypothetical protein
VGHEQQRPPGAAAGQASHQVRAVGLQRLRLDTSNPPGRETQVVEYLERVLAREGSDQERILESELHRFVRFY